MTDTELVAELEDGRKIAVSLSWYPRLEHATANERQEWELLGGGSGIHWVSIDEDISVESLLQGKPSNESQASFARWLTNRAHAWRAATHVGLAGHGPGV